MNRPDWWKGRRVLVTGLTGFKGSWLGSWLAGWGAQVGGLSLAPATNPSLFVAAGLEAKTESYIGDIRNPEVVDECIRKFAPEMVFHLAAQPLVRLSYREPVETYATNVMGTIHVMEAVRRTSSVRGLVCVTSDKCYENREWLWGYRENDPMGGYDPYSSSKGACELAIAAWRRSFFSQPEGPYVASVRAGNVIGGGDWSEDRLIPDIVRAFEQGQPAIIRNPNSTRPWQHVLEPLNGYMLLMERLVDEGKDWAEGWNFGPDPDDIRSVRSVGDGMVRKWGEGALWQTDQPEEKTGKAVHEAQLLALDSAKARQRLGWRPVWDVDQVLTRIVDWSKGFRAGTPVDQLCAGEIESYLADERKAG